MGRNGMKPDEADTADTRHRTKGTRRKFGMKKFDGGVAGTVEDGGGSRAVEDSRPVEDGGGRRAVEDSGGGGGLRAMEDGGGGLVVEGGGSGGAVEGGAGGRGAVEARGGGCAVEAALWGVRAVVDWC
uniref:Uncharacterized protein n=1 Tax=Oryza sativa subsp. japonica TaxID=39947 RepID=Q5SNC4_ORYSJ|nr:hypothetical protein [Oryza sativa Japonica Group]